MTEKFDMTKKSKWAEIRITETLSNGEIIKWTPLGDFDISLTTSVENFKLLVKDTYELLEKKRILEKELEKILDDT